MSPSVGFGQFFQESMAAQDQTSPGGGFGSFFDDATKPPAGDLDRLRASSALTSTLDPDRLAKAARLGQDMSVPTMDLYQNMETVEAIEAERRHVTLLQGAPRTREWAGPPENLALARDDLENLSSGERFFTNLKAMRDSFAEPFAYLGARFEEGRLTAEMGELGYEVSERGGYGGAQIEARLQGITDQLRAMPDAPEGFVSWVGEAANLVGQQTWTLPRAAVTGATAGVSAAGVAAVYGQMGPQVAIPEEVVTVPTAFVTAGYAALRARQIEIMQRIEAGHSYLEQRQIAEDAGVAFDHDWATGIASTVGFVNGALEFVGGEAVMAPFKALVRKGVGEAVEEALVKPTMRTAIGNFARNYALAVGGETSTEMLQEVTAIIGEEVYRRAAMGEFEGLDAQQSLERVLEVGESVFKGMAILGLPGAGSSFVSDVKRARQAERTVEIMESLGDEAARSRLRERYPEKYAEWVDHVTQGGDVDTVYIEADQFVRYFQGAVPDQGTRMELYRQLGLDADTINEAVDLGADVAIPLPVYTARIAGSEHHTALMQDARFRPEDMTPRVAATYRKQFAQALEEARQAAEGEATLAESGAPERVYSRVVADLVAAGQDPSTARRAASIYLANARVLEGLGYDPEQFIFDRMGLKIMGPDGEASVVAPVALEPDPQLAPEQADAMAPESLRPPAAEPTPPTDSRPSRFQELDPLTIETDAPTFQFKSDGDDQGWTGTLEGVKTWNQSFAGVAIVWEAENGTRYIVDGHQRLGLARRLASQGQEGIRINAEILREADGYTPQLARLYGALKNLAEGGESTSALDVARVVRETDDLTMIEQFIPPRRQAYRDGVLLARLGDEAFGLVFNKRVDPLFAVEVARVITDPQQQMAVLGYMIENPPANRNQARMVAEAARNAGFSSGVQEGLFGAEAFAGTLLIERARVIEAAVRRIRAARKAIKNALVNEATLEAAGNQIDSESSAEALSANEQLALVLETQGTTRGGIFDAVGRAAESLRDSGDIKRAVDQLLADIEAGVAVGPANPDAVGDAVQDRADDQAARPGVSEVEEDPGPSLGLEEPAPQPAQTQTPTEPEAPPPAPQPTPERAADLTASVQEAAVAAKRGDRAAYDALLTPVPPVERGSPTVTQIEAWGLWSVRRIRKWDVPEDGADAASLTEAQRDYLSERWETIKGQWFDAVRTPTQDVATPAPTQEQATVEEARAEAAPAAVETTPEPPKADRLRAAANSALERAETALGTDRNTNTARRARMAASAEADAARDKRIAETGIKIADAIERGEAGSLAGITSLAQIREIETALRRAIYAAERAKDKAGRGPADWKRDAEAADVEYAELPTVILNGYDSPKLAEAIKGKKGLTRARRILTERGDGPVRNADDLAALRAALTPLKSGKLGYEAKRVLDQMTERDRLVKLGATDDQALRGILLDYLDIRAGKVEADPLKAMERALVGVKIPGFFQTPEWVATKMVEWAALEPGQTVLEPSAGAGRIARAAAGVVGKANIDALEVNTSLSEMLERQGFRVVSGDFTAWAPGAIEAGVRYDAVLMNPPFEKGQDMDHVRLAFDLVKPGGRLVAITAPGWQFRQDKRATEFRDWFEALGGEVESLPSGTFQESGTGVETRIIRLDKAEAAQAAQLPSQPVAPSVDRVETADGMADQLVIPGAEQDARGSDRARNLALVEQASVDSRVRRGGRQSVRDQDGGLFDAARDQTTLFQPPAPGASLADHLAAFLPAATLAGHPEMVAAMERMRAIPNTSDQAGYMSEAWKATRLYRGPNGQTIEGFDAAVAELERVARAYAEGDVARDNSVHFVLGPPAAGKSSAVAEPLARAIKGMIVDPDDAKKMIPEFGDGIGAMAVHEESSAMARALLARVMRSDETVILPKVGDNAESTVALIQAFKAAGKTVHVHLMQIPPDEAFRRMVQRFVATGRLIDPDYAMGVDISPTQTYIQVREEGLADGYAVYDNAVPLGEKPRLVEADGAPGWDAVARRAPELNDNGNLPGDRGGAEGRKDRLTLLQSAWHASRSLFDRFSTDFMGSGEGAQAFGWGLYFASRREVANWYRTNFKETSESQVQAGNLKSWRAYLDAVNTRAAALLAERGQASQANLVQMERLAYNLGANLWTKARMGGIESDPVLMKAWVDKQLDFERSMVNDPSYADAGAGVAVMEAIQALPLPATIQPEEPRLYRVELAPTDDEYLLWDKPLKEQSEKVRAALEPLIQADAENIAARYGGDVARHRRDDISGADWYEEMVAEVGYKARQEGEALSREVYQSGGEWTPEFLARNAAIRERMDNAARTASLALRDIGIRGIKYLDGGSRTGDAEGSHNFVIFDAEDVAITSYEQRKKDGPRAQIEFGPGETIIRMFEGADLSSLFHESGHFFLATLEELARDGSNMAAEDLAIVRRWVGRQDANDTNAFTVEEHEKFARGFEAYLMEGKAPSQELQDVFTRFRRWLTAIYRTVANLEVDLNDEIREVFDRLLASDDEIRAQAQAHKYAPLFDSPEAANLTRQEFADYLRAAERATAQAEDELARRLMRQIARRRQAELARVEDTIRPDVEAELAKRREFQALQFLATGEALPGQSVPEGLEPIKLDRQAIVDGWGREVLDALPKPFGGIYRLTGGVHPDAAAELFGFGSGDELIQKLKGLPTFRQAVEAETRRLAEARMGDAITDGSIAEEAMDALHSDARGAFLAIELKAIARRARKSGTPAQIAKEAAETAIARKPTRDAVRWQTFLAAERRAGERAEKAILEQDFDEAARQKRKQLFNHYLYMASRAAADEVEKIVAKARRYNSAGTRAKIEVGYLDQIDALLERFDFRKVSDKAAAKRQSLRDWIAEQESAGHTVVIPRKLRVDAFKVPYRDLALQDLRDLADSLANIEHLGRLKEKLKTAQEEREYRAVVDELVDSIMDNATSWEPPVGADHYAPGFGHTVGDKMAGFWAAHAKPEFLFTMLDGDQEGAMRGPAWTYLFRPLAEAQGREQDMRRDYGQRLSDLMSEHYTLRERMAWPMTKRYIQGGGVSQSINKETALSLALNWGNEGNRQRIIDGNRFPEEFVAKVFETMLDARDWRFVQGVWKQIDSLWPQIAAHEREMSGVTPEKVEPAGFQVRTSDGKTLDMEGGYYPIRYDADLSYTAFKHEETQTVQEAFGGNWAHPQTRKGHVEARAEKVDRPIRLGLSVIPEHISNVIHDLTHRAAVLQVDRLLQERDVREAIEGAAGKAAYRQLRPWLVNIAGDARPTNARWPLEGIIAHARVGASIVNMGLKVTTAMVQPLGYLQSVELLGEKWAAKALLPFVTQPWKAPQKTSFALSKSPELRNRQRTFDRDARDVMKGGTLGGMSSQMKQSFFYFIGLMDMTVAVPTWLGAYEKYYAENAANQGDAGFDADAVQYADSIVRMSQSAGGAKDLATVQFAGGEVGRMFTVFYSYFSVLHNLLRRRGRITKKGGMGSTPRFVASMLYLWWAPAVLSELLAGRGPDEEEGESWAGWMLRILALYPLATMVMVRDVAGGVFTDFDSEMSPINRAWEATAKALKIAPKALDPEEDITRGDVKGAVEALGYWAHLPSRQMWITGSHAYDVLTGQDDLSLWELMVSPDYSEE